MWMDPRVGRVAFNIAVLLAILAAVPLPFLSRDSAEFVVGAMALIFSLIFLAFVTWDVRRQVKRAIGFKSG